MVLIEYYVNSQHTGLDSEPFPSYVAKLFLLNHILEIFHVALIHLFNNIMEQSRGFMVLFALF